LGKHINGEIVNADAMQLYNGLNISTAKVTKEEMENIPHHLIGIREPGEAEMTVRDFRDLAIKTITDIASRGKLPILVGGTLYYVQSILWPSLIDEGGELSPEAK
jgi:tRNA dimethylallyltransferase